MIKVTHIDGPPTAKHKLGIYAVGLHTCMLSNYECIFLPIVILRSALLIYMVEPLDPKVGPYGKTCGCMR